MDVWKLGVVETVGCLGWIWPSKRFFKWRNLRRKVRKFGCLDHKDWSNAYNLTYIDLIWSYKVQSLRNPHLEPSMPSGKTVRRGWRSSVATVGWVWHHRMGPRRGPGGVLLSQGWRMGPENMARFLLFDVYDTCMFENRSSQKEGILSLWNGALKFTKVHEIAFAIVFQWSPRPQVCKSFESLAGKVTKIHGKSITRRY